MTGTAAATSYNSARGSGCKVIDSMDAGEGDTFLTCNSSTGYDCVVTVGDAPGTPRILGADLRRHHTTTSWPAGAQDDGVYDCYAGTVHLYAPGARIDRGGRAESTCTRINHTVHYG
ncbi:spore-associated protein A [Streptomyces sp. YIM B13518]|uniref:spore-associated protein A n=1 Tax=Streptomyces sp. YIM B13518 TaxID=3366316 RepID=UPI003684E553